MFGRINTQFIWNQLFGVIDMACSWWGIYLPSRNMTTPNQRLFYLVVWERYVELWDMLPQTHTRQYREVCMKLSLWAFSLNSTGLPILKSQNSSSTISSAKVINYVGSKWCIKSFGISVFIYRLTSFGNRLGPHLPGEMLSMYVMIYCDKIIIHCIYW